MQGATAWLVQQCNFSREFLRNCNFTFRVAPVDAQRLPVSLAFLLQIENKPTNSNSDN